MLVQCGDDARDGEACTAGACGSIAIDACAASTGTRSSQDRNERLAAMPWGKRMHSSEDFENQVLSLAAGRTRFFRIRGLVQVPESTTIVCRVRILEVGVLSECQRNAIGVPAIEDGGIGGPVAAALATNGIDRYLCRVTLSGDDSAADSRIPGLRRGAWGSAVVRTDLLPPVG